MPLSGEDRARVPLFCDELRAPLLYSAVYKILDDIKKLILTDEFDPSLFTLHSFRVYLATSMGAAGRTDAEIQAVCRWQSSASLEIYNRLQPDAAMRMLDEAQAALSYQCRVIYSC